MQLTEGQRRLEREEIEFLTEVKGVQLRLGYLRHKDESEDYFIPDLSDGIAWELGIQPDSDTGRFIAVIKEYIERRSL